MPVCRRLHNSAFTPEHFQAMGQAFEETITRLGLVNRDDPIVELVAKKIIELGLQGERDSVKLREQALMAFTVREPRTAFP